MCCFTVAVPAIAWQHQVRVSYCTGSWLRRSRSHRRALGCTLLPPFSLPLTVGSSLVCLSRRERYPVHRAIVRIELLDHGSVVRSAFPNDARVSSHNQLVALKQGSKTFITELRSIFHRIYCSTVTKWTFRIRGRWLYINVTAGGQCGRCHITREKFQHAKIAIFHESSNP